MNAKSGSLINDAVTECRAMIRYALGRGLQLPDGAISTLEQLEQGNGEGLPGLENLHGQLAKLVAPASPRTIDLLEKEHRKKGLMRWLGPVPIVRRMMVLCLIFLAALLSVGLSDQINRESVAEGILASNGSALALNLVFLLAAAGLGACFANLKRAQSFVDNGTFDSRHDSSYWSHLVLGLTAGLILAELVPVNWEEMHSGLGKPALAMLGGFSATMVHRVLQRLVTALESVVKGDAEAMVRAGIQQAQLQADRQVSEARVRLAGELMQLGQGEAELPQSLKARLSQLATHLIDGNSGARSKPADAGSRQ